MVAVAGVTAIEVKVLAAGGTVTDALPLTPLSVAVTLVAPGATAVPIPDAFTVAIAAFPHDQLAVLVTSAVVPSRYLAVAVYCCVFPMGILTLAGATETAVTVFAVTTMLDDDAPHPAISSENRSSPMNDDREIPRQR
jgi:hypothetical protein